VSGADQERVPRFAPSTRFRYDEVRKAWLILAPERVFLADEQATEILKLVDGSRTLGAIIDVLAARFAAPREVLEADVTAMLRDLGDKGAIVL
jgi:pyrroloquinoline quinone biosynthesis protein D